MDLLGWMSGNAKTGERPPDKSGGRLPQSRSICLDAITSIISHRNSRASGAIAELELSAPGNTGYTIGKGARRRL